MEELLAKTVVMNGLKVGRVVDVLLGPDAAGTVAIASCRRPPRPNRTG